MLEEFTRFQYQKCVTCSGKCGADNKEYAKCSLCYRVQHTKWIEIARNYVVDCPMNK